MPKPALFLHIQKTAGTSIQGAARKVYGNDQVVSHADCFTLGIEKCAKRAFVSGHFGFEFARPLMEGRYSFTFLRDPVERLISFYAFCLTRDPNEFPLYKVAQEAADLEAFLLACLHTERDKVWNHQTWQLAYGWGAQLTLGRQRRIDEFNPGDLLDTAKRNLATLDCVGMVETFDNAAAKIMADLEWGEQEIGKANASPRKPALDSLPASTRSLLLEMTELDRELVAFANAR